ncbi:uncharacterized protein LOC141874189 [Acropora palmata]|uniref:uncharacterized protein LOC141874189 n=1 Tax=Acropora palmata TaxID=6131 RepID=UPI003DA187EE
MTYCGYDRFLNGNLIKSLDSYAFSSLSSLELLNLADNPLQELNDYAFYIANSSLHTIYLMNTNMERINIKAFEGQQLVKAYISPDHLTEGFAVKDNTMPFMTLTAIGFAHGNWSYRLPCSTGTFVPPLKNFKPSTILESKCIPCPPGGFYSDGIAVVGQNCFPCNNGTYVPPERAPGKSVRHCIVCPTDVTKTDVWFPQRPQSWRIQHGLLSGIAVCSTKTASEEKRLVYLAPNCGAGDRFFSF